MTEGLAFIRSFERRTNREVSIGAVYATLDRLEAKGYVKSHRGDPTPERGGRAKRFFRVTAKGIWYLSSIPTHWFRRCFRGQGKGNGCDDVPRSFLGGVDCRFFPGSGDAEWVRHSSVEGDGVLR
jgi:hypothetical protein